MATVPKTRAAWWREWPLALTVVMLGIMLAFGGTLAGTSSSALVLIVLLVLCGVILCAAVAIVRHADVLAHRLGEPLGTLLLTLAITGLEVAMVGFVMSTGDEKPTLARDTMFAVVMLVLNGFLGLSLVMGGVRHREQSYNLQGANAFLVMIVPLTVLGLVLPNYTRSTPGPTLSTFQMVFLSLMSAGIYIIFMLVQNRWYQDYFRAAESPLAVPASATAAAPPKAAPDSGIVEHKGHHSTRPTWFHALMLILYGVPVVMLAKQMAAPLDVVVAKMGAPIALGGFVMAVLVLTPESLAAIAAARQNQLQRSVNILMGSVLASIGLTIPLVIVISLATGRSLVLGLDATGTLMLLLTLVTSILTFSLPRTNVLLGCVHLLLFAAYLMLMFDR